MLFFKHDEQKGLREVLREWLEREKTLSFEAQKTKFFWWIQGNNNTDPYGRNQESD